MELSITVLGTSAGMPSKERSLGGICISYNGENILFDPAENTQQQLMKAGLSAMKISNVFISHFHADHFLGLPGLIASMNMLDRTQPLNIYGTKKVKEKVSAVIGLAVMKLGFPVNCFQLKKGVALEKENYSITAFPLKHSSVCYGFAFKEKDSVGKFNREKAVRLGIPVGPLFSQLQKGSSIKLKGKTIRPEQVMDYNKKRIGRKISIVADTLADESYVEFIKGSDLLVHESVFSEKLKEKALETKHSTASEAARIAKKAKVKKLVLTHFSSRYKSEKELLSEAKKNFSETELAKDLMKIELKLKKL